MRRGRWLPFGLAAMMTLACGGERQGPGDVAGEDVGARDLAAVEDVAIGDPTPEREGCPLESCEEGARRCAMALQIEECVRTDDGCLEWRVVGVCPTDYPCQFVSACVNGECVEYPWPAPADEDDDGWCAPDGCCPWPQDCDDADPAVHPSAPEICDGKDDDCDGETDAVGGDPANLPECLAFYADRDVDGRGDPHDARCLCFEHGVYTATTGDDCDDQDPSVPSPATGCVGGCPDGVLEGDEVCDDDNNILFDGCESCTGERNYVNPPDMRQAFDPAVARRDSGLVVAWSGPPEGQNRSSVIYARLLGPDLTLSASVQALHDGSSAVRGSPALATRPDGGFLAVWDAWGVDGDEFSVQARAFSALGASEGPEVTVNEHWQARQLAPAIAVSDDLALVAWQTHDQDGDGYEVYARFLGMDAAPQGPEFRVNQYLASDQYLPVVTGLPGRAFAVAYVSRYQGAYDRSVVVTAFDASHQVLLPETVISREETGTEVALAASETLLGVASVERSVTAWQTPEATWWVHVRFIPLEAPKDVRHTVIRPEVTDWWDTVGARSPALVHVPGQGFVLFYLEGSHGTPKYLRFDEAGSPLGGGDVMPASVVFRWFASWPAAATMRDGRVVVVFECSPAVPESSLPHGLCLRVLPTD